MSYGSSIADVFRQAGAYCWPPSRGAKPGDLAEELDQARSGHSTDLTARALGLEVPPTLLARADEVIE